MYNRSALYKRHGAVVAVACCDVGRAPSCGWSRWFSGSSALYSRHFVRWDVGPGRKANSSFPSQAGRTGDPRASRAVHTITIAKRSAKKYPRSRRGWGETVSDAAFMASVSLGSPNGMWR